MIRPVGASFVVSTGLADCPVKRIVIIPPTDDEDYERLTGLALDAAWEIK